MKDIYYTTEEASKKIQLDIEEMIRKDPTNTYVPIDKIDGQYYVSKFIIDKVVEGMEDSRFNKTTGMKIVQAQNKFMTWNSTYPNTYAITIATRHSAFNEDNIIDIELILQEFVRRANIALFGKKWREKKKNISLHLTTENKHANIHFHGFISFSEKYDQTLMYIQKKLTKILRTLFYNGSTCVKEITDARAWVVYSTKQLSNPSNWRGQRSFEQTCDGFMLISVP